MATKLNVGDVYGPMYIESINGNEVVARCEKCHNGIIFTNFKDENIISIMRYHICKITSSSFYDGKKIGSYILVNLKRLEDGTYTGIAKCTICKRKFTFTGTPQLLIPSLISMSCDFFKPDVTPIQSDANFTTIKRNPLGLQYKIDIESKIEEFKDKAQLLQIEQIIEDYKNNPPIEEDPEEPIIPDTPEIPGDDEEEEKPIKPSKPGAGEGGDLEDLETPIPM